MAALRCKQGDLAYIVSPDFPPYDRKFVTCVQVQGAHPSCPELGPCWTVRPEGWVPPLCTVSLVNGLFGYPDSMLRPIRPQPAAAVDEMVLKVGPAPMTLTEIWEAAHG